MENERKRNKYSEEKNIQSENISNLQLCAW